MWRLLLPINYVLVGSTPGNTIYFLGKIYVSRWRFCYFNFCCATRFIREHTFHLRKFFNRIHSLSLYFASKNSNSQHKKTEPQTPAERTYTNNIWSNSFAFSCFLFETIYRTHARRNEIKMEKSKIINEYKFTVMQSLLPHPNSMFLFFLSRVSLPLFTVWMFNSLSRIHNQSLVCSVTFIVFMLARKSLKSLSQFTFGAMNSSNFIRFSVSLLSFSV